MADAVGPHSTPKICTVYCRPLLYAKRIITVRFIGYAKVDGLVLQTVQVIGMRVANILARALHDRGSQTYESDSKFGITHTR